MDTKEKIMSVLEETIILGAFKSFCENNRNIASKQRLRNIFARASNKSKAVKGLFANEMHLDLSDEEAGRLFLLIDAFLRKSSHRKTISIEVKKCLLLDQNYKCRFCNQDIDLSSHADHIVPFKYVGDELENNLQMLCSHCNKSKNSNIDFEIRTLLHIV